MPQWFVLTGTDGQPHSLCSNSVDEVHTKEGMTHVVLRSGMTIEVALTVEEVLAIIEAAP